MTNRHNWLIRSSSPHTHKDHNRTLYERSKPTVVNENKISGAARTDDESTGEHHSKEIETKHESGSLFDHKQSKYHIDEQTISWSV